MSRTNLSTTVLAVALLTAVAFALRAVVAYNSGMWADEGSFLNVIAAPSWGSMIDFLKQHESHPPFFYFLMRIWGIAAGWGDRELMIVPVVLGALIVPAIYFFGAQMFSRRAALISSGLAAASAPLIEHSAQLRPYGLLALLVVVSTGSLARVLTRPLRVYSVLYVLSSVVMIYTHHWGWIILAGQYFAAAYLIFRRGTANKIRSMLRLSGLMIVIALCYAPWIPALLYQLRHAGHGPLSIEGVPELIGFLLFATDRILETLLLGRLADRRLVAAAGLVLTTVALIHATRSTRSRGSSKSAQNSEQPEEAAFQIRLLFLTAGFALLTALVLSPLNNLLQARGISTVMPLLLLGAGYEIDKILLGKAKVGETQLVSVLLTFGLVTSTFEIPSLLTTRRSNVREISRIVESAKLPNDILVLTPEWFAGSFDHYFPPSIEQIDFPYDGRSSLISFSDVWQRRQSSTALPRLAGRLAEARRTGRRAWLVLDRRYLRVYTEENKASAFRHRQPEYFTMRDVRAILSTLTALYGPSPRVFETGGPRPIHDEFVAYLFSPPEKPVLSQ